MVGYSIDPGAELNLRRKNIVRLPTIMITCRFSHERGSRLKGFAAFLVGLVMTTASAQLCAAEVPLGKEYQNLDKRIQTLKASVLSLGQDLSLLNKGMLAFSGNPLIIYITTDLDDAVELQAIELEINGNFVARQEFLPNMLQSLQRGGALRFLVKELPAGDYDIKAWLIAKVGKGRDVRTPASYSFAKEKKPKTIELRVSNVRERFLPTIEVQDLD